MNNLVLIVDDDTLVRAAIRNSLKDCGALLLAARNGGEALSIVYRRRPDLVLMDIHMPEVDGIVALEIIKQIDPGINVIMISCDRSPSSTDLAIQKGASGFLTKPIDYPLLERVVEVALRTHSRDAGLSRAA